jgi:hypothetical protein
MRMGDATLTAGLPNVGGRPGVDRRRPVDPTRAVGDTGVTDGDVNPPAVYRTADAAPAAFTRLVAAVAAAGPSVEE